MSKSNLSQAQTWMHNVNLRQYRLVRDTVISGINYKAGSPICDGHTYRVWASWKTSGHMQFQNASGDFSPRRPKFVPSTPWKTYATNPDWPTQNMIALFIGLPHCSVCHNVIPVDRVAVLPDTTTCVNHSNVKRFMHTSWTCNPQIAI